MMAPGCQPQTVFRTEMNELIKEEMGRRKEHGPKVGGKMRENPSSNL